MFPVLLIKKFRPRRASDQCQWVVIEHQVFLLKYSVYRTKTMYLISNGKDIAEWFRAELWSERDLGGILADSEAPLPPVSGGTVRIR